MLYGVGSAFAPGGGVEAGGVPESASSDASEVADRPVDRSGLCSYGEGQLATGGVTGNRVPLASGCLPGTEAGGPP